MGMYTGFDETYLFWKYFETGSRAHAQAPKQFRVAVWQWVGISGLFDWVDGDSAWINSDSAWCVIKWGDCLQQAAAEAT